MRTVLPTRAGLNETAGKARCWGPVLQSPFHPVISIVLQRSKKHVSGNDHLATEYFATGRSVPRSHTHLECQRLAITPVECHTYDNAVAGHYR